jgi:predicted RNase H-like nuclease
VRDHHDVRVLGVDGDKKGWLGVVLVDGRFEEAHLAPTLQGLVEAAAPVDVIAVDMPIGLVEGPRRAADRAARALLSRKAASVFNAPPACVWDATGYEEANRRARATVGSGLSRQSWGLMPKIREATELQASAGLPVVEAHPELSFAQLHAMEPVQASKYSWAGQHARLDRLETVGIVIPDDLGEAGEGGAADVVDASVVAHTAHRVGRGEARSLPEPPERADIGADIAIWL